MIGKLCKRDAASQYGSTVAIFTINFSPNNEFVIDTRSSQETGDATGVQLLQWLCLGMPSLILDIPHSSFALRPLGFAVLPLLS